MRKLEPLPLQLPPRVMTLGQLLIASGPVGFVTKSMVYTRCHQSLVHSFTFPAMSYTPSGETSKGNAPTGEVYW